MSKRKLKPAQHGLDTILKYADGGKVKADTSLVGRARALFAGKAKVDTIDKQLAEAENGDSTPVVKKPDEEEPKPFRFKNGGKV